MPVTPQITITGNLMDLLGALIPDSFVVVQLCGYGSEIPRINGTAIIAQTAPDPIDIVSGAFNFKLWGNDVITPAGTFYTIQIQDANGNIVQTNAYQFTGVAAVDLSTVVPYNPAPFVPPVPPANPPNSMDVIVAFAFNAIFNALNTLGIVLFEITLTADLTAPTLINVTPGQIITLMFIQGGAGGYLVTAPGNVLGLGIPDPALGRISLQSFVVRSNGNLYPIGPMITI
jgi:hypothetical protein